MNKIGVIYFLFFHIGNIFVYPFLFEELTHLDLRFRYFVVIDCWLCLKISAIG